MLCTYEYPSSSQETTKHFLAIVGGLHIISFSHYFWTQDIQRTGNLINNQSMHFDLIDEVNHHDFDANYHITLTLFSQIKVAKGHAFSSTQNPCISNVWTMNFSNMNTVPVHRCVFCQFPRTSVQCLGTIFTFQLIYIHANKEIDATKLYWLKNPRTFQDLFFIILQY